MILSLLLLIKISAQPLPFNYISPVPGSKYINPEQAIILKTGSCFDPLSTSKLSVSIFGSQSGTINPELKLSDDNKILFIIPEREFLFGEHIKVVVSQGLRTKEGTDVSSISFDFFIRDKEDHLMPLDLGLDKGNKEAGAISINSPEEKLPVSTRENNLPPRYPAPTYVYTSAGAAEGAIFFTPAVRLTPQYDQYLTIWDNYGTPVYYNKMNINVTDFQVIDDGVLAYSVNGLSNPAQNCYYLMNGNYDLMDSIRAGFGYNIDNHDILLLENGHYLILIYDRQTVNMSLIVPGGNPNAQVTGLVIQEVDNDRNVFFQWRSWDHFQITDATWDIDLTAYAIDYVHANAIALDSDGNILVSCRHLDEITKIDFSTGSIIWRWGLRAKNNEFTFTNDQIGFSHQHDIRKLTNGNYTVYDNGNLHLAQVSRAREYHLDENNKTATLVWGYQHDPVIYAPLTGGNQRLPNNNRLVGWGGNAPLAITEVNSNNQVVFELFLPDSVSGYRARKYPWQTSMFTAQEEIDFGNFSGYLAPKKFLLQVTNNYTQTITITSAYNLHQANFFVENLPVSIFPGGTAELPVFFQAYETGLYQDVLTLNYDNPANTRRIARQVKLSGLLDASLPSIQFNPANGSENVHPGTEIIVTFSEPVRKIFNQELKDSDVPALFTFKLSNQYGGDVPFHGTVSDDKTTVTIIPDQALNEQQRYYIRQKPFILTDFDGNLVDYSDFCYFTTGNFVEIAENVIPAITFYPNPAKDILFVESKEHSIIKAEVFSADGQLLYSGLCDKNTISIKSGGFPAGVLMLRIHTSDGKQFNRQFVHF